jgi:hypothetical protein
MMDVSAKTAFPSVVLVCLTAGLVILPSATRSETLPIIPKWGRFEQTCNSTVVYANAPQQATLTFLFTSPLGDSNRVDAFWDGGQTWRARFSPNQAGRWSYLTLCSDQANKGLHHLTGAFLCTAATGHDRFTQHGPVQLARDHRHFVHEDGTPFLWLADSPWDGARLSDPDGWETYARVRVTQKFTAVQWTVAPGKDENNRSAFTGRDRIVLNPGFFQRLDARVDTLNRAGLLSVIALLPDRDDRGASTLPEDQLALLLRYLAARWSAYDVAWLLKVDGRNSQDVERSKKAGRSVFGQTPHAPVILLPDGMTFGEFRNEDWVDAFGFKSDMNEKTLRQLLSESLAAEWQKEPARPLLNVESGRENMLTPDQTRVTAEDVGRALWRSLLLAPPAGAGYSADAVATWNKTLARPKEGRPDEILPMWHKSLYLPGARQIATIAQVLNAVEYWRLRPAPHVIASLPDAQLPGPPIAFASTEANDLSLVYVPGGNSLRMFRDSLPPFPILSWINPQTGGNCPAVAVVDGRICQFPTPAPGDWLLTIRSEK